MSRLDPLRERQEFIEAMEARARTVFPGELGQPARDINRRWRRATAAAKPGSRATSSRYSFGRFSWPHL